MAASQSSNSASAATDRVRLNVGGRPFTTTRATLTSRPDSLLGRMFSDERAPLLKADADGSVFLDVDPDVFARVLGALRHQLPLPERSPLAASLGVSDEEWRATLEYLAMVSPSADQELPVATTTSAAEAGSTAQDDAPKEHGNTKRKRVERDSADNGATASADAAAVAKYVADREEATVRAVWRWICASETFLRWRNEALQYVFMVQLVKNCRHFEPKYARDKAEAVRISTEMGVSLAAMGSCLARLSSGTDTNIVRLLEDVSGCKLRLEAQAVGKTVITWPARGAQDAAANELNPPWADFNVTNVFFELAH